MRLILLHNPEAGDDGYSREELESLLREAGHEIVYRSLKEEGWDDVLHESRDLIVVAGGDGSVRKVFTALDDSPTTATLFPTGSANNIATTLGFDTDDPAQLLAGWEPAARKTFDVWEVESTWGRSRFVESFGGGLFADVLVRALGVRREPSGEEKVDLGLELVREALEEAAPEVWRLEIDGTPLEDELLGAELLNVRGLGPQLELAPAADPGDEQLDVVLIAPGDREELAAYVDARLRDEAAELPELEICRDSRFVVEAPPGYRVHVDDVLPDEDLSIPRRAEVRRADVSVDVLVPARRLGP